MLNAAIKTWRALSGALLLAALAACSPKSFGPVNFVEEGKPEKLSEWRLLNVSGPSLKLNYSVMPYELNTPLFTDHAHKLRTIWMRSGSTATAPANVNDVLNLPVGTIISKTFYYPKGEGQVLRETDDASADLKDGALDLAKVRLIETRLLVHRKDGWVALPYVWNAEQTDAELMRTGDQAALTMQDDAGRQQRFPYVVPNENQCASCHMVANKSKAIQPIGLKLRHINRLYQGEGQLEKLIAAGYLARPLGKQDEPLPKAANWQDPTQTLDARARAYLDINCAHCHNPKGPANNTGLNLEPFLPLSRVQGICKPPVAAGKGTGDRSFGIVPGKPDESIITYRLASTEGGEMMPELGRSTAHAEGVALIKAWIAAMPAGCKNID